MKGESHPFASYGKSSLRYTGAPGKECGVPVVIVTLREEHRVPVRRASCRVGTVLPDTGLWAVNQRCATPSHTVSGPPLGPFSSGFKV